MTLRGRREVDTSLLSDEIEGAGKVGSTGALYSNVPGFKPQHRIFGPIISMVS